MKHIENSQKEIEDTVNNLNIGIMMTNYYFDTDDYFNIKIPELKCSETYADG